MATVGSGAMLAPGREFTPTALIIRADRGNYEFWIEQRRYQAFAPIRNVGNVQRSKDLR